MYYLPLYIRPIIKSHGYDNVSVRIVKVRSKPATMALKIILEELLKKVIFPEVWKKLWWKITVLLVYFLLLVKYLNRQSTILFNSVLSNKLFTFSQSRLLSGDSYIAQLLSITHETQTAFDGKIDVRGVFLDIFRAFDKVWHDGIIFKLKP